MGDGGTILHSTDGGATWQPQASGTDHVLHGVAFTDRQHGWAVGLGGIILHTTNGGVTWKVQASGNYSMRL